LDSGWLVDNNVPRSVTLLLSDKGYDVVEVRAVLAHDAPDDAVVAYARARGLVLITHDRGCARRALASEVPHVWLRTREIQDRDRLEEALPEINAQLKGGAIRISLFLAVLRGSR
jgi:predicted nuclease of predicted toxin-antitoxin system